MQFYAVTGNSAMKVCPLQMQIKLQKIAPSIPLLCWA